MSPTGNDDPRERFVQSLTYFSRMASPPPQLTPRPQSPPRAREVKLSPRPSSRRRPLHDRKGSQTNESIAPTIRVVEDSDTHIYSKTPFPSHPSQILPPRKAPGHGFEDKGLHVSDQDPVTNVVWKSDSIE